MRSAVPAASSPAIVGRYALFEELASGGMAAVHLGRLLGPQGFNKTVAIKRLHAQYAKDPEFVSMFLDEARIAARIRHNNVVSTLDVVADDGELFLVMEYVQGESLSRIARAVANEKTVLDPRVVCAIMTGVLHGLHAAHEATSERGEALGIVHRDVSPQNIVVGVDGVARVLDFGVAKAAHRVQTTREGQVKGKLSYMAPEQLRTETVDRRTDIYAAGVVMWEALTGERLFDSANEGRLFTKILLEPIPTPRSVRSEIPEALETIVMRSLERDPNDRYGSAREMALAIEAAMPAAPASVVGSTVERLAADVLGSRRAQIAAIESQGGIAETATPTGRDDEPAHVVSRVVSTQAPPGDRRPRLRAWVAVPVSALVAGVVLLARTTPRVPALPSPSASNTFVVAAVEDSPPASASAPASSIVVVPTASPTSSVQQTSSAPADASTPHRAAPSKSTSRATTPHASGACASPFFVDSAGIHHMKPECMP